MGLLGAQLGVWLWLRSAQRRRLYVNEGWGGDKTTHTVYTEYIRPCDDKTQPIVVCIWKNWSCWASVLRQRLFNGMHHQWVDECAKKMQNNTIYYAYYVNWSFSRSGKWKTWSESPYFLDWKLPFPYITRSIIARGTRTAHHHHWLFRINKNNNIIYCMISWRCELWCVCRTERWKWGSLKNCILIPNAPCLRRTLVDNAAKDARWRIAYTHPPK